MKLRFVHSCALLLGVSPWLCGAGHAKPAAKTPPAVRKMQQLKGPSSILQFPVGPDKRTTVSLVAGTARFEQKTPLAVEIVDEEDATRWLYGSYTQTKAQKGAIHCQGEVISPAGTRFRFFDTYSPSGDGFQLQRRVEIASPNPKDTGFSSRFGMKWTTPETVSDCDVLMPGAWYRDNKSVPPRAFGAHPEYQMLMYRDDRLGLPLVEARDKKSGASLILEHIGGNPTTFAEEGGNKRATDERLQMGALGFLNTGQLEESFSFPGTEDERPTLGPDSAPTQRFMPRSHPVKVGVRHSYTLRFGVRSTPSFPVMVASTTKAAIARAHPPLIPADLNRVYRASLDLLDAVIQPYNGTVSVPFQAKVPSGEVIDTSMQMGFVGMAIPCAALLLKDGLETNNQSAIDRATQVVDFWAQQSPNPSGVPKNWSDFPAPNRVTWRDYPTHLRIASDGMSGALRAWKEAKEHGIDKPQWLAFARSFGDFLVKNQNPDGSWYGTWNFDGTPHDRYTNASTHPLEFLVELSKATADPQYQQAALRAGEFCWTTVHQAYSYVGGTPDNPNVTDKEAGIMAIRGFMALYDATGDRKWLDASQQAALFCETWVYWRDLPMPADNPKQVFPPGRTTVGLSLISTGHSGTDNFMAVAPFLWYRLYLATGDAHFLQSARLLLHDTKQLMDWDGKLGYKYPGLLTEAMGLATGRGKGVAGWLPWLTIVVTQPMVQLKEAFGTWDIDQIEKMPLEKRRQLSAKFAATRGF